VYVATRGEVMVPGGVLPADDDNAVVHRITSMCVPYRALSLGPVITSSGVPAAQRSAAT
jgi:hypothetical protein